MSYTIPSDTHVPGDQGHASDHDNIADVVARFDAVFGPDSGNHVTKVVLFTAPGSGTTGAIITDDITVQPNSGISASASMFLDNLNPLPVNQHGHTNYSSVTTAFATPSVTPSVTGCLALAAAKLSSSANTLSGVSSGWTNDVSQNNNYHGTFAAHKNALTTDTSTAISNTFTLGMASGGSTEILLIAPSPGGSPSIVQSTGQVGGVQAINPIPFTLTSTPTPGNLLVAFISYSLFLGANTVPTPAGWTLVEAATLPGNPNYSGMVTFWRIVQPGDGKNWSFNQTVPGDYSSGAMYEVQQELNVSQVFEVFNNSSGQFGVYDKTNGVQVVTIRPGGAVTTLNNTLDDGNGNATIAGVTHAACGTDTSSTATASSPSFVSGTAAQCSTTQDVMLYIAVNTVAALAVAIGPTSGVADTIVASENVALGVITLRIPKSWYVKITGTIADLTITQVTC